ncbi:hypothetical protein [Sinorhizobium meliloti]|uniref:hypothetical protein n=1 Tax=Rhizobium meliloti TaxID=382 RepID=UPI001F1AF012|nr:hypothetical protein [Sinorhizobium meliloti]
MKITVDQIRRAMRDLAGIIDMSPDGERYWPIFERLERELVTREDRAARLKAARSYNKLGKRREN